jgi:asparagine synthase (glutamine-hydrolysing)
MRVVGLISREVAAVERFAERWRDRAIGGGNGAVRVRCVPANAPLVAVAMSEGCHPPLQWAEDPTGSFALLDGEVFGASDRQTGGQAAGNDAAALAALYAAKGPDGLAAMNGGAALVIFDAHRRSLLLFRDRYGQVPIFYAERPEGLYWASDIPSLLAAGVPGTLDVNALDYFLSAGYVPAPWTFVEAIRKVPPAHYLRRIDGSSGEIKPYWVATGRPKLALSPQEAGERLGELVEQAIRRRSLPGRRIGVLLSGGVDSALLIGCLASRISADVEAFTFRYGDYEGKFNEFDMAHETAEHFQVRHQGLDYGPVDVRDNIEDMVRGYGEPFIWGIHTFNLRKVAEAGVGTLFSGAGADSWTIRWRENLIMQFRRLPGPLRELASAALPALAIFRPDLARRAEEFLYCARSGFPICATAGVISDANRRRLYRDATLVDDGRRAATELLESMREDSVGEGDRDRLILLRQRLFFAECNLFWNHVWARANNLALRHPYSDNDIQDFAMRLPHLWTDKDDLRSYAEKILPREKAYAPKIFHKIPIDDWFRGPLQAFLRDQLSPGRLTRQGLFEPRTVAQLIDEHVAGQRVHTWRLLALLTVTVWLDVVLKSAVSNAVVAHSERPAAAAPQGFREGVLL